MDTYKDIILKLNQANITNSVKKHARFNKENSDLDCEGCLNEKNSVNNHIK